MKGIWIALLATLSIFVTATSKAQADGDVTASRREWLRSHDDGQRFHAGELTVDLSGNWQRAHDEINDFFSDTANEAWGGGFGLNYFFLREFGVGLNSSAHDNGGAFVDTVAADAILRLPINAISTAPYILGGAGRVFEPSDLWEGHFGAGIEFRLNPHTGIFGDARYLWVERGLDRSQIRLGFRFAF